MSLSFPLHILHGDPRARGEIFLVTRLGLIGGGDWPRRRRERRSGGVAGAGSGVTEAGSGEAVWTSGVVVDTRGSTAVGGTSMVLN